MIMGRFLENRKSVREYKEKKLDQSKINKIEKQLLEVNRSYNKDEFEVEIFENGEDVYRVLKGKGGYSGVMVKSPQYLGLVIKEENKDILIKASYALESIITELTELGLGTCWISLKDVNNELKKEIIENKSGNLEYLLAFGYSEGKVLLARDSSSSRLSVEDIVYLKKWGNKANIEELETRGLKELFYYVRFVPSNLNLQPWRFVLEDDKVFLYLKDIEEKGNIIDGGIMMYYFEKMAHSIGVRGMWKTSNLSDVKSIENYSVVGEFIL